MTWLPIRESHDRHIKIARYIIGSHILYCRVPFVNEPCAIRAFLQQSRDNGGCHTHARTYIYIYTRTHIHARIYTHVYSVSLSRKRERERERENELTSCHECTTFCTLYGCSVSGIHTYTRTHSCIYTRPHTNAHTHTHIHTLTHTFTHTHTLTHTDTRSPSRTQCAYKDVVCV